MCMYVCMYVHGYLDPYMYTHKIHFQRFKAHILPILWRKFVRYCYIVSLRVFKDYRDASCRINSIKSLGSIRVCGSCIKRNYARGANERARNIFYVEIAQVRSGRVRNFRCEIPIFFPHLALDEIVPLLVPTNYNLREFGIDKQIAGSDGPDFTREVNCRATRDSNSLIIGLVYASGLKRLAFTYCTLNATNRICLE